MQIDRRHFILASASAAACAALPLPALAAKAKSPVAVKNPAALAGVRQAVIGSFAVGFLTERVDRAKAGGGLMGGGFGGRSTAKSYLAGLTDADFIAATEAAYAAFLDRLGSAGITLGDRQGLIEAYGTKVKPLPNGEERNLITGRDDKAKARVFSPAALGDPVVLMEWLGLLHGGSFDFSFNMSVGQASMAAKTFAKTSGQPVINALLLVDFANAESYGGWFRNTSAVNVKSSLAAFPDVSQLTVFAPGGKVGQVILKEPVAMGGDYGTFEDTTGGTAKTVETISNVIGFLGGVGTNKSRKYTMTANPDRWREGMDGLSREALARLTASLTG
ncbi:hypothetical protein [Sphingomonas sp. 35-24ZXX]|uniref:hypothetical protein n=1 Tax=Sphingomonas sp. 35-24ZXX TaxID=1545915 RepID=UPI00053C06E7|nr:hypothetical protein [Sphingomonas sp. 35-24ZXX]